MSGSVEIVVETRAVDPEVEFFVAHGFRLESILPADDPSTVVLSCRGTSVRIVRSRVERPVRLRIAAGEGDAAPRRSPGGSTIEATPPAGDPVVPDARPSFVVSRPDDATWVSGRAGMRYRDLLPGRWGGRYVASHIHIAGEGPVPDYVHFHRVSFQLIVVMAGWVEVVYEDQGPAFVLGPGDGVLQPPTIRHRVLRSGAGLEVVEVTCPAEHVTVVDHDLDLPTETVRPDRDFGGQRFARFVLADAEPGPSPFAGFAAADTGFAAASGGVVGARILEPVAGDGCGHRGRDPVSHDGELSMLVVLAGEVTLEGGEVDASGLGPGAAIAVPAGHPVRIAQPSSDARLLEVTAPA